ncbi:MAG TPA: GAF domain-containing protein [Candidatus Dormibacteraeota bacterium]|nr:GAF domain-containing protein [Candidatus Dormibacteraeota bacterium]
MRLESELQTRLLRSIVGATVALFEAEAASIALYRPATETLEFVIAAGAQGQGVVGMSIPAAQGIAGYAFTSGEPIAISDPEHDPRFTKDFSAGTGYVPRTILAMPMRSQDRTIGILEVLDKHQGSFSMRDIELASVFADQAAVAIQVGALALDSQKLIRTLLAADLPADDDQALQELISAATREQSGDDRFWEFVDAIVGMRLQRPEDRELAVEMLDVVVRHSTHAPRFGASGRLRR